VTAVFVVIDSHRLKRWSLIPTCTASDRAKCSSVLECWLTWKKNAT